MAHEKRKKWLGKAVLAGGILLGIVIFRYFELGQYLSLDYLKASRENLQVLYLSHRVLVIAAYMGIYIVVTALSLPGAVVMTLAGGGLFGLVVGTVAVSFASTIGATLACLVSRYLLRDWVQSNFGDKLTTINAGIEKDGAFYLFSLRLVPVFPFFVINLLMGLTRMRLFTFFWVSQIGMLAGTIVFVNAGRQLARIESLSGILSPGVLISFVGLGLFPITVKKLLTLYKGKFRKSSESETRISQWLKMKPKIGNPMKTYPREFPGNRPAAMLLFTALLFTAAIASAAQFDPAHPGFEALLKRYVTDGRVDYQGLKGDITALDHYLDRTASVSEAEFNAWSESERLVFLINLYNAATLRLIIDHYPIKSIKDIGNFLKGPWDQPVVDLFAKTITLNHLEHDIIRKHYNEPRIHLALVCAAKGCPTLRHEPYIAGKMDEQLDNQCRMYLSSPAGLRMDRDRKTVYFSSLFKWYGKDFVAGFLPSSGFSGLGKTQRAVANFCSGYLSASDGAYLQSAGYSVKYLDYDWSLNEK
jgi:uncharacterized membrane protein YdjX (TVP38/TMEM64 family)